MKQVFPGIKFLPPLIFIFINQYRLELFQTDLTCKNAHLKLLQLPSYEKNIYFQGMSK